MKHISTSIKREAILLSRTPEAVGAEVAKQRDGEGRPRFKFVRKKSLRRMGEGGHWSEHRCVAVVQRWLGQAWGQQCPPASGFFNASHWPQKQKAGLPQGCCPQEEAKTRARLP